MHKYISLSLGCHLNIMERIWIISTSQVLLANFILLAFFFFFLLGYRRQAQENFPSREISKVTFSYMV